MGLSRLSQLLTNISGRALYVNPDSIDATDSIENRGNSPTRPFVGLNRAISEAVRYSYQIGPNNDRFAKCTIFLSPGYHRVTNRPGWIPDGANNFKLRNGTTSSDFSQWNINTNFDITANNNALYKLNSIHGGIILPRGVSIIGQDYRKTIIVPDYIPNPENDTIESCALFLLTGQNYINEITIEDPTESVYIDYTNNKYSPRFSQHKLTDFEMADGVNPVYIDDGVINYSSTRTDLQIYYEKIGLVFGSSSGREIQPDYPSTSIDIQPRIDEYRIVGSRGKEVIISSIQAGDGITATTNITVTLSESISELDVNTPIRIQGVPATGYDGQYIVKQILNSTQLIYEVSTAPVNAAPSLSSSSATLNISVDTITSSSPYIFNVASKTVWGRNGLHADGSKISGFKSVVVAQFTGIGLQKDPKAFVKYNETSGVFEDFTAAGNENIQTSSRAYYKPSYENFHIKVSNDAYIQVVSVFAIGYANQFLSESGADQSINASNSNFGAKALVSRGYRNSAFIRDDVGYITHIIPPKEIKTTENAITYESIDVGITTSVGNAFRLYFYNRKSLASPPESVVEGFRIGAKPNDELRVRINSVEYASSILMQNGTSSGEKVSIVSRSNAGINSIASNTFTLAQNHEFLNGESVRVISENGQLPNSVNSGLYYVITTGSPNQIKLAQTFSDAISNKEINVPASGGPISIVSRVSDKNAGEIGHPLQFDSNNGWYITIGVSLEGAFSSIYFALNTVSRLTTERTYFYRKNDNRSLGDTIYKFRYVIPASANAARQPLDGYIIQESGSTIGKTNTEIEAQFNPTTTTLSSTLQLRNQKLIASATWVGNVSTIVSEMPHNLTVGSKVELVNIKSTNNTTGLANTGFNGTFTVSSVINKKTFTVTLATNPGSFISNTSLRTTESPYFIRKNYKNNFYIYKVEESNKHIPGVQDGVYYLTILNSSNYSNVEPFKSKGYSQPVQYLYPQKNRDNPVSDPKESTCFTLSYPLGQVVINNPQNSLTKETLQRVFVDQSVGIAVTNIISNSAGTAHTILTSTDHGLNPITTLTITSSGSGYGVGSGSNEIYYNARLTNVSSTGENATACVTVNSAGSISSIRIMDGGSNYKTGDRLNVVGIATTTGFTVGIVSVFSIYNHVGESIKINKGPEKYNTSYRISGITSSKNILVSSASSILSPSISGIGTNETSQCYIELTGKAIGISSIIHSAGIATITTIEPHDLYTDNKIFIGGVFNNKFLVDRIVGLNTFTISTGSTNASIIFTETPYIYRQGASSNGGEFNTDEEGLRGRMIPLYSGITTSLSSSVNSTATSLDVTNARNCGLRIGDYLQIDEEIVRISTTVTSNSITVFRGVLGTRNSAHSSGAIVYKISAVPIELRRNSLIRASAHTFEYNGYGSGNYSSSLPDRQDRTLTQQEELLAQSTKEDGGIVVFSGMNANGSFYVGNKKVNSATGTEEIFDTPIPTFTGEDVSNNAGYNNVTTLEATINRSLYVEGGTNKSLISQFDGPVIFNNKITSNSEKGIETSSLLLYGNGLTPRNYTVGESEPNVSGNPGDVQYNSNPLSGGFLGWVYTSNNRWEKFGKIGLNGSSVENSVGISSNSSFVGLSTLIDIKTSGITLTSSYDSRSGITTLNFVGASALGNSIGVSTFNNFVGLATQINFTGTSNIDVVGFAPSGGTGINTVRIGISSNSNITATGFIKKGATSTNFLKADGSDSTISYNEVTTALGYVPANSASVSGDPASGNSIVLDQLDGFNGITSVFDLKLNGNLYVPIGNAANLIVSLGGVVQKPGTDYYIPQNAGINTSKIQFTDSPTSELSHFIVALGGQSSLLGNASWNAKGDLAVGTTDNNAQILSVGNNGHILMADNTTPTGLKWTLNPFVPIGGIIMWNGPAWAAEAFEPYWALCDGRTVGGYQTPDLRDRFIVGSGGSYESGNSGGEALVTLSANQMPSHTHSVNDPGHSHSYLNSSSGGLVKSGTDRAVGQVSSSTSHNTTGIYLGNTGGSQAHENRPPYYALAYLLRTFAI
jgi:microcystin-dependent protein